MNKTVTVNLGGMVFYIDEEAYEMLHNYLEAIRKHFRKSEGAGEIIADIESRFAELFNEKIVAGKQVVIKTDVEEAIRIMGKPEDIAGEDETSGEEKSYSGSSSGYSSGHKKFYRNPDNKIIGGVCGGIGAYFNFDPLWLRLAFAGAFFFFGTGFLLYLVLMIIIPKARTTAEKLEMRGEDVNINNIEKSIKEEFENLKEKLNDFKSEAKNFSKSDASHRVKSAAQDFFDFIGQILSMFFKVLGKLIAVVFIIIGLIVVASLSVGVLDSMGIISGSSLTHFSFDGYSTNSVSDVANLFFASRSQMILAIISIAILIGIPFLKMIISGIKMLFNIKTKDHIINIFFSIIWSVGLVLGIIVLIQIGSEFSKEAEVSQSIPLQRSESQILFIDAVPDPEQNEDDSDNHIIRFHNVSLRVVRGESSKFELEETTVARGRSIKDATERAKLITFSLVQKDSLLLINPLIQLPEGEKFRHQRVRLVLKVPEGKSVHFGYDLEHVLRQAKNESGKMTEKMLGHTWIMGEKKLSCSDCGGF